MHVTFVLLLSLVGAEDDDVICVESLGLKIGLLLLKPSDKLLNSIVLVAVIEIILFDRLGISGGAVIVECDDGILSSLSVTEIRLACDCDINILKWDEIILVKIISKNHRVARLIFLKASDRSGRHIMFTDYEVLITMCLYVYKDLL